MTTRPAFAGGRPVRRAPLPFHRPLLGAREAEAVGRVLRSGWITAGPRVAQFERALATSLHCRHVVAVSSCTAGLTLALDALGIGRGDEVITTPLTFVATANVIVHRGARPRFVDVDPMTLNLDPTAGARAITRKTRAILPVHLGGQPCDLASLLAIARRRQLVVIEDAAHAFGARYRGRPIGTWGDATVFSFHAVKNLTTAEGGLVATRTQASAERIRRLAFHGMDHDAWHRVRRRGWRYVVREAGYKANLTDLQAAIGLVQLRRFAGFQRRRRRIVAAYQEAFASCPELILPREAPGTRHAWHLYLVQLRLERVRITRDTFLRALAAEGILGNLHYLPVHLQPFYRRTFGYRPGSCPVAERAAHRLVTLPLYPAMTDQDVADVVEAVTKVVRYYAR